MKRRTLLQAGLASLLLPRMEPSVACEGNGSGPVDGKGLEQGFWAYAARAGSEKVSRIVYWIARCFPSPDAPIYFSVAYRGLSPPRSTVYAVFSGIDVRGNRRAMVYKHSAGQSHSCSSEYSLVLEGGQVSDQAQREPHIRQFRHIYGLRDQRYLLSGEAYSQHQKVASRYALQASDIRDGKAYSLFTTQAAEMLDGRVRVLAGRRWEGMAGYYPNRPNLPGSSIPAYRYHRAEYFSELEVFHQRKSLARVDWSMWTTQHMSTTIYLPQFPEGTKLDVHLKHNSGFSSRREMVVAYNKNEPDRHDFEQAL